jgi:hypothetical protein
LTEWPEILVQHPIRFYDKPAGGLGSLHGTAKALRSNSALPALKVLPQLNQPGGVDCPGCAYPDLSRFAERQGGRLLRAGRLGDRA